MTSAATRVELTSSEYLQAMVVGCMRCCEDRKLGRRHAYGARRQDAELHDIVGAIGEAVVAKYLGAFWLGTGTFRGHDVATYQVRSTKYDPPFLCLHSKDDDDKAYICTHVCEGVGVIHGWMYGSEGKAERYFSDRWKNGRPAFWVPHTDLHPIEELPR